MAPSGWIHQPGSNSLAPSAELSTAVWKQDQVKFVCELPEGAVNYLILTLKSSSTLCLSSFPAGTAPAKAGKLTSSFQLPPPDEKKNPFKAFKGEKKVKTILI